MADWVDADQVDEVIAKAMARIVDVNVAHRSGDDSIWKPKSDNLNQITIPPKHTVWIPGSIQLWYPKRFLSKCIPQRITNATSLKLDSLNTLPHLKATAKEWRELGGNK